MRKIKAFPLRQIFAPFPKSFFASDYSKDYYKVLGVNEKASEKDIKMAFYKMAKKYHPDVYKGSQETFKQVNEAYEVLGDVSKRKDYDSMRAPSGASSGPFGNPSSPFGSQRSSSSSSTGSPFGSSYGQRPQSGSPFGGSSRPNSNGFQSSQASSNQSQYYYEQYQKKEQQRWNPNASQKKSDFYDDKQFQEFFKNMNSTFDKMRQEAARKKANGDSEGLKWKNTTKNQNYQSGNPWERNFGWGSDYDDHSSSARNKTNQNDAYYKEYYKAKMEEQERRQREYENYRRSKEQDFRENFEEKMKDLKMAYGDIQAKAEPFAKAIKVKRRKFLMSLAGFLKEQDAGGIIKDMFFTKKK